MVYQDATGLYHFVINGIPFISNSVVVRAACSLVRDGVRQSVDVATFIIVLFTYSFNASHY